MAKATKGIELATTEKTVTATVVEERGRTAGTPDTGLPSSAPG
jgi:hypothetical protein